MKMNSSVTKNTNWFKKHILLILTLLSLVIFITLAAVIFSDANRYVYSHNSDDLVLIGFTTLSFVVFISLLVTSIIKRVKRKK